MRILKVTQSYAPFLERGGPAVKVRALARGLAASGHRVTVLTTDLGRGRRDDLGQRYEWGWRSHEGSVETVYLPTAFTFRSLTVNPRLSAFCRARLAEFDLVHIYGLYDLLGPTTARQAARAGIPCFVEPMGMYLPIDRGFFLKGVWRRAFGNRMIAGARSMIVTSEIEREDLLEGGVSRDRIRLRYNPVDLAEFGSLPPRGAFRSRWQIAPEEPLVIFLSRLIPRKGADLLIEAFALSLPERGTLVIAGPEGEAGYLNHLRGVAEWCGAGSRVRFTGALYGDEKRAALVDADVFALPSAYENFANAAAEAVACSLPVVVTDRCGIHSLIEGRAGLVVPREKKAVAEALRRLVEDAELRGRLRAGCPAVVRELSLEKTVATLEDIYAAR